MVALLKDGGHFILLTESVCEFLIAYVEYVGSIDTKVFRILANSNKMSTEELIEYINDNTYSYSDKIEEIYEIGKRIY